MYGGLEWDGEVQVNVKSPERSSFKLTPKVGSDAPKYELLTGETHSLTLHKENKGTWHLSVYSPYWMVNKTTLTLQYSVCLYMYTTS